jgi:hypothetical protein
MPADSPLGFTSDQLAEVIDIARRVPVYRRGDFLEALAEQLGNGGQLTAGQVRRAAIQALNEVRGG